MRITENSLKFARDWYNPAGIHHAINNPRPGSLAEPNEIPTDHKSMEFAQWLAEQYQLAMVIGAELVKEEMIGDARLGLAIERACQHLPEDYSIRIDVERHAGTVDLVNSDGESEEYPSNHENLAEEIRDALEYALAISSH